MQSKPSLRALWEGEGTERCVRGFGHDDALLRLGKVSSSSSWLLSLWSVDEVSAIVVNSPSAHRFRTITTSHTHTRRPQSTSHQVKKHLTVLHFLHAIPCVRFKELLAHCKGLLVLQTCSTRLPQPHHHNNSKQPFRGSKRHIVTWTHSEQQQTLGTHIEKQRTLLSRNLPVRARMLMKRVSLPKGEAVNHQKLRRIRRRNGITLWLDAVCNTRSRNGMNPIRVRDQLDKV